MTSMDDYLFIAHFLMLEKAEAESLFFPASSSFFCTSYPPVSTRIQQDRATTVDSSYLKAEVGRFCSPKQLSSPRSRPCLIMYSPSVPSGCGYMFTFDCPRILDIVFIVCILSREAANTSRSRMKPWHKNTAN